MNEARYLLREFRDTDYEGLASLQTAIYPEEPMSAESLRHMVEGFRQTANPYQIVVEDRQSEEMVGIGAIFHLPFDADPRTQWLDILVLPDRQRQGIGTRLYSELLVEGNRRATTTLRCSVRESSASGRGFLARYHFVERRRVWRSSLDVASADLTRLDSLVTSISGRGIEFTTLAKEGIDDLEVLRRIYDLDAAAGKDIPRDGELAQPSFEEFRRFFFEGELVLPNAWFLAKQGSQYIGVSSAAREPAQPHVLQQYFTGTRREARRQKIALALKLMVIDFAKRNGFTRIETSNDSLNAPMWTLNQSLGFRKVRESIQLSLELNPDGPRPTTART